jgi:DnaJ family protein C protein 17
LDSNRRRLKEELEAKERAAREDNAKRGAYTAPTDEERLREEVDRLRREGSKILEQENEFIRKQIEKEIEELKAQKAQKPTIDTLPRLKCKWDRKLGLDEKQLRTKFQSCGRISCLVVSKKGNSAIVEFERTEAAVAAYNLQSSTIEIEWLQGKPTLAAQSQSKCPNFAQFSSGLITDGKYKNSCYFDVEYEQKVLDKMRNAQRIKNK